MAHQRYPDALPEHSVPAEKFNKEMAQEAYEMAAAFLKRVQEEVKP